MPVLVCLVLVFVSTDLWGWVGSAVDRSRPRIGTETVGVGAEDAGCAAGPPPVWGWDGGVGVMRPEIPSCPIPLLQKGG